MSDRLLTGTRVRNRRLDLGLRQADVARSLGISASYLNLIEHNRRRIGATLLGALADALDVDAALLEDETAASVLAPLQEAAAAFPEAGIETVRAEDLVARYPGWAALIAAQHARIAQLEARTEALTNRLAHDTQIATSLHDVISTATAIRSTATILVESPDLDTDWQSRFHKNIDTDSARLAESSQALLGFLDMEMEAGGDTAVSAVEAAEGVMARAAFYMPQVETGQMPDFEGVADPATRSVLHGWAKQSAEDAKALPLEPFLQVARALAFDPARLAERYAVPFDVILRRLAYLPAHPDTPLMGLARCDAAGVVTFQKPVLDFRLPRSGAACPLWPLYQSMSQTGRPLRSFVRLPGQARTAFECFAVALPQGAVSFGAQPRIEATMLVRPARGDVTPDTVGPGCRVCPVSGCASRRQPSVL